NTDSNSRLCMAAAVAGYRTSLGSDGPPCCYDDLDLADVVLIIGSNMAEAHPVTFDRLRENKQRRPAMQIIVVDPRRTPTAAAADLHIPVAPGGDIALLNALGRLLLQRGAVDPFFVENHTRDFDAYPDLLLTLDPKELCETAGVSAAVLERAAGLIAPSPLPLPPAGGEGIKLVPSPPAGERGRGEGARRFLSFYCMGLNQSTVGM